jgi:hypothetical protein
MLINAGLGLRLRSGIQMVLISARRLPGAMKR